MTYVQAEYEVRCEWGLHGAEILAPICDAIIVVDVLSFSTAVTVATARGAIVFPYRWKDESCQTFAESKGAILAGPRGKSKYSLSPLSLTALKNGQRIVLPGPNGSNISVSTGETPTFTGCLRNAHAIAHAAVRCGNHIGVIPCGERWQDDFSFRFALEDMIGAGAIIQALPGRRSPEAEAARAVFLDSRNDLLRILEQCLSGKELIQIGYRDDIARDRDSLSPFIISAS